MGRIKAVLIVVLTAVFFVHSAEQLDFSKRRNFYLGEGEFGSSSLIVKSFETFDYQSEIKKPFVLKKINNSGLIEIIYDSRTLSGDELKDGKTYSATFSFTKKNIGKKENIVVSAVYRPELRIVVRDSLLADFKKINFTPDKTADTIKFNALKNLPKVMIDNPNGVITVGEGTNLSFEKGESEVVVKLVKKENFEEEILLYRNAGDARIGELFLVVSSTGFKAGAAAVETAPADSAVQTDSLSADSAAAALYADIPENTGNGETDPSPSGFSMMSIIIMSVMGLIILFLLFLIVTNKKSAMYDRYQTFFEDIASLVKVNPKGSNIDKTIEEIMMILLEKFEYSPGQSDEPAQEKKKTLKKPANLKSPGIIQKSAADESGPSQSINLDFGDPEESADKTTRSDKPLDPKPTSSGDKKISRGFDFLEEDN